MGDRLQEEGVLQLPWKVGLDFIRLRETICGARKLVNSGPNQRSMGCSLADSPASLLFPADATRGLYSSMH